MTLQTLPAPTTPTDAPNTFIERRRGGAVSELERLRGHGAKLEALERMQHELFAEADALYARRTASAVAHRQLRVVDAALARDRALGAVPQARTQHDHRRIRAAYTAACEEAEAVCVDELAAAEQEHHQAAAERFVRQGLDEIRAGDLDDAAERALTERQTMRKSRWAVLVAEPKWTAEFIASLSGAKPEQVARCAAGTPADARSRASHRWLPWRRRSERL